MVKRKSSKSSGSKRSGSKSTPDSPPDTKTVDRVMMFKRLESFKNDMEKTRSVVFIIDVITYLCVFAGCVLFVLWLGGVFDKKSRDTTEKPNLTTPPKNTVQTVFDSFTGGNMPVVLLVVTYISLVLLATWRFWIRLAKLSIRAPIFTLLFFVTTGLCIAVFASDTVPVGHTISVGVLYGLTLLGFCALLVREYLHRRLKEKMLEARFDEAFAELQDLFYKGEGDKGEGDKGDGGKDDGGKKKSENKLAAFLERYEDQHHDPDDDGDDDDEFFDADGTPTRPENLGAPKK